MEMWRALHTIWCPIVVLAASPSRTSSGHIRVCRDGLTQDDGLSRGAGGYQSKEDLIQEKEVWAKI
jgi:hypothetical protein